jgi:hypothetical protein
MRAKFAALAANKKFVQYVTVFGSAAVGAATCYLVMDKRLESKYSLIAQQEIAESRRYHTMLAKDGKLSDPISALETFVGEEGLQYSVPAHPALAPVINDGTPEAARLIEAGERLAQQLETPMSVTTQVSPDGAVEVQAVSVEHNVFEEKSPALFDLAYEMSLRTEDAPYIITQQEYYTGEKDYTQSRLVYFAGDDTLVDEHNEPIVETDEVVGDANLQRFGAGSKDNRTVHIRNDRIEIDFEVVRNESEYAREVLGLRHSDDPRRRPRRMRDSDDG